MGAHTALVLADLYPDLVSHLIMVEVMSAAAAMRCARPEAGYHAIPGAGHDVHLDQPERWHQLLESLLTARMRKL